MQPALTAVPTPQETAPVVRKNGYYYDPAAARYKRSVTNITRLWGDSEGLLRWGAKHASTAVWTAMLGQATLAQEEAVEVGIAAMLAERDRTADWGSGVHTAIEHWLGDQPFDLLLTESQRVAYHTFQAWFQASGARTLAVERVGFAPTYAGRVDAVFDLPTIAGVLPYLTKKSDALHPGRYLCDIKTGSLHLDTHWLQLAAYTQLDSMQALAPLQGALVINIPRDNPTDLVIHAWDMPALLAGHTHFTNLVALWDCFAPKWYRNQ